MCFGSYEGRRKLLKKPRKQRDRMNRSRGRGRNSITLSLLLLHVSSQYSELDRKPPVTAGLIAANTLVYLRPGPLDYMLPSFSEVSLSPYLVVQNRDLKRLFLSAFYHEDESHLVYNIFSLFSKGVQLETMMGSTKFASMVAVLLGLSHGIVVVLAKVLATFFDDPYPWTSECTIGFSSVLFALNVVLNSNSGSTSVYGVLLPQQYAAWAELLIIQMIVPKVSFLGNLSGIFAGLLYLWLKRFFSGSNPLSRIIRKIIWIMGWPRRFFQDHFTGSRSHTFGHGMAGGRVTGTPRNVNLVWRCPQCYFDNNIHIEICEICGTRQASGPPLYPTAPASVSQEINLEELRRQRLKRFDR